MKKCFLFLLLSVTFARASETPNFILQERAHDRITREEAVAALRQLPPAPLRDLALAIALIDAPTLHTAEAFLLTPQSTYLWSTLCNRADFTPRPGYDEAHALLDAIQSEPLQKQADAALLMIRNPELHFTVTARWVDGLGTVTIISKNIDAVEIELFEIQTGIDFFRFAERYPLSEKRIIRTWREPLPKEPSFQFTRHAWKPPHRLDPGLYGISIRAASNARIEAAAPFQVSNLIVSAADISGDSGEERRCIYVNNDYALNRRRTDIQVEIVNEANITRAQAETDSSGSARLTLPRSGSSVEFLKADVFAPGFHWEPRFEGKWQRPVSRVRWFFDQPGYRPGQTVNYQVFVTQPAAHGTSRSVVGMSDLLYVNGSGATLLETDAYGSHTGAFAIPEDAPEGWLTFSLRTLESDYNAVWVSRGETNAVVTPPPLTLTDTPPALRVGDTATFRFASGADCTRVEAIDREGLLFAQTFRTPVSAFTLPVTGRMRGGFTVRALAMSRNSIETQIITRDVDWNRTLTIETLNLPGTFRANEEQTWRFKLSDPQARLTATLRDAALDGIAPPPFWRREVGTHLSRWCDFSDLFFSIRRTEPFALPPETIESIGFYNNAPYLLDDSRPLITLADCPIPAMPPFQPAVFFKTGLAPDKDGIITLTFTAPKGRWRLNLLAYTEDLSSAVSSHLCEAL